jgi:hypothetical protein
MIKYISKHIFIILLVMFFCSCKKCMTCSTYCYTCDYLNQGRSIDTICSNGLASASVVGQVVARQQSAGYTCKKMTPTQSFQYCDDNKAFISYMQTDGLVCQ